MESSSNGSRDKDADPKQTKQKKSGRDVLEVHDTVQPTTSAERTAAEQVLLQAEQFRTNINASTGNVTGGVFNSMPSNPVCTDNDDDFLHVTCHINRSMKEKIERGEFVDLEKLLPRVNFRCSEDSKLELVAKDDQAYFTPAQDRNKITGIRKWEQAFHVYAAIYSKANPHRASKIWQYIYVINLAASSYASENVAFYDMTFRQLMSSKPLCRWSKTYVQGWNLAMTDPISKARTFQDARNGNVSNSSVTQSNGSRRDSWKDRCCWKYNRNKCNRGNSCDWDHHCLWRVVS